MGKKRDIIAKIRKTDAGKPFIDKMPFFSLSHTTKAVAVSTCKNQPTGVDAELLRHIDVNDFSHYLSREEKDKIKGSSEEFLRLWCTKEAVFKAAGTGLREPFTDVVVMPDFALFDHNTWYYKTLIVESVVMSVCCARPFKIDIQELKPCELRALD
ncbi:4'-phosphopantetheinyl transferase family protein [Sulfurospirillum barnesii]|uniref:4'-phosphopantetheinyl transferase family protein n=1 Tax=Sulfurospirillum barnesii TaxID=44674 RepID=UPI0002F2FA12|nr:4'-phosphopantetheinyl transferase superfamily protein [Sulfurospirillum barnesii]